MQTSRIKLKIAHNNRIIFCDIQQSTCLSELSETIRQSLNLDYEIITIKWIDQQDDACTISSEMELDEAKRLYSLLKMDSLIINVLNGEPSYIGGPCLGEENLFRNGAKRWKQVYCYNSHHFERKIFTKISMCLICNDIIWGIGRQGVRCGSCKLFVHKKCCHKVSISCEQMRVNSKPIHDSSNNISPSSINQPNEIERRFQDLPYIHGSIGTEATKGVVGLSDFEFVKIIGRGSYAKVIMVRCKKDNKIYALKVIKKKQFFDENDIDWIQAEKRVFEAFSNFPFTVNLHSCFQSISRLFFVIEYVGGGDLMYHMQKNRRLNENETKFYSAEISLGLNYLHKNKIVYRDLKLDNVLICNDGHVKLTDFGMCKEGVNLFSRANTFCGTPNYIAPEVLRNENYGYCVDWWAFGVLVFEMLAGRSPFDTALAAQNPELQTEEFLFHLILEREIRIPRFLSVRSADFIKKLLKKNPRERLCCNPDRGISEFQNHSFFKNLDWADAVARKLKPPYIPKFHGETDHEHFDSLFTDEPVQLTPDDPLSVNEFDQSQFEGFEYINPNSPI